MKMQTGNSWSCLPCSFAMALGIPVEKFIRMIGHDGGDEPYEDYPGYKAGFHEQECIEVLQQLGYACTPIEIIPQLRPVSDGPIRPIWFWLEAIPRELTTDPEDLNWQRFIRHLKGSCGVLTGTKKRINGKETLGHAVAWGGKVYDPQGKGFIYAIEEANNYGFIPRGYWKIEETVNGRTSKDGSSNIGTEEKEKVQPSTD